MNWKKTLTFVFCILAGIVLGSLLASLVENIPVLKWLSYTARVGFGAEEPAVLDLSVLKISLGFSLGVNVAQIILIIGSLLMYRKLSKGLS